MFHFVLLRIIKLNCGLHICGLLRFFFLAFIIPLPSLTLFYNLFLNIYTTEATITVLGKLLPNIYSSRYDTYFFYI